MPRPVSDKSLKRGAVGDEIVRRQWSVGLTREKYPFPRGQEGFRPFFDGRYGDARENDRDKIDE
jgi:hypothetical protein